MPEEDDKILEAMIKGAEKAPEPGELRKAQVLDDGKGEGSAPMVTKELTSAGYVYIYNTRTGARSRCNRNMLLQHLKKTRPDKSIVFTLTKPDITPKVGKIKCLLHADDPNRKLYDQKGFVTCPKSNLTSPFQRDRHMKKRHKQEWEDIEKDKQDAEKAADKDFQRQMLRAMVGNKAENPVTEEMEVVEKELKRELYVSDKDRALKTK